MIGINRKIILVLLACIMTIVVGCSKNDERKSDVVNQTEDDDTITEADKTEITDSEVIASVKEYLDGFVDYPLIPSFNGESNSELSEWIGYEVLSRKEGFSKEQLFQRNEISMTEYDTFAADNFSFGEPVKSSQRGTYVVVEGYLPALDAEIQIDSVSMDSDGKYYVSGHNIDRETLEKQWREVSKDGTEEVTNECINMVEFSAVLVHEETENGSWKLVEWKNVDVSDVVSE